MSSATANQFGGFRNELLQRDLESEEELEEAASEAVEQLEENLTQEESRIERVKREAASVTGFLSSGSQESRAGMSFANLEGVARKVGVAILTLAVIGLVLGKFRNQATETMGLDENSTVITILDEGMDILVQVLGWVGLAVVIFFGALALFWMKGGFGGSKGSS